MQKNEPDEETTEPDVAELERIFNLPCTRAANHTGPCNGLPCAEVKSKMAAQDL